MAIDGDKTFVVRKKETINEFFNEDIYCLMINILNVRGVKNEYINL